jgi:hypothetical protein
MRSEVHAAAQPTAERGLADFYPTRVAVAPAELPRGLHIFAWIFTLGVLLFLIIVWALGHDSLPRHH